MTGTARVHYDPHVDIDWESPWQEDLFAMPPESVSLYGTRRWNALSADQRRTLALHEAVSLWSTVAYLSAILTGNQLRRAAEEGLNSPASRAALEEVAGGSRTTITFGRLIRATSLPPYRPPVGTATAVKLLSFLPLGSASHAATLLVEETFARAMDGAVADVTVEPHVRQAVKIHDLDCASRFRFARSEVIAAQGKSNRIVRAYNRFLLSILANVILRITISPAVYRSVGLSSTRGLLGSRKNRADARRRNTASVVEFLESAGMLDGVLTARVWKFTGVLPQEENS